MICAALSPSLTSCPCFALRTLKILIYPHPALRQKAQPLATVDQTRPRRGPRMLELMHEAPGVGLAAPQVGLPWRLFVTNPTGEPQDDLVFINPTITAPSRESEDREEGCLSLPNVNGQIRRPVAVTITAQDLNGQTFTLEATGLPARVWQHEYDHLDGVLIIDKMTRIDRLANREALRQLEEEAAPLRSSANLTRTAPCARSGCLAAGNFEP